MMTRDPLIRLFSGRGADPLFGVSAELRSRGRKVSRLREIADPLAVRQANKPGSSSQRNKIRPRCLTERPPLKQ
jgi:hypothetical protein